MKIADLVEYIRLSRDEIQNVKQARDNLVTVIKNKAKRGYLPRPINIFLTGSYKRGTKISPLDDVDIFYVVGEAKSQDDYRHIITHTTFDFGNDFKDKDNNISSIKVLNLIKKEISKTYRRSEIRRNGEVVNVYLSSYEVGFDIVPAWRINNREYYLIPEGGRSTRWKKSNPKWDEYILSVLNEKHKGLLKDIIRVVKYWFNRKKIKSLRSYHLESIFYHMFGNKKKSIKSHLEGLLYFYGNIINNHKYRNYLEECPDPTGLSEPLSSNLTYEDINRILLEADKAIKYLKLGEDQFVRYVAPEL